MNPTTLIPAILATLSWGEAPATTLTAETCPEVDQCVMRLTYSNTLIMDGVAPGRSPHTISTAILGDVVVEIDSTIGGRSAPDFMSVTHLPEGGLVAVPFAIEVPEGGSGEILILRAGEGFLG
jgi:hypothetical protein